MSPTKYGDAIRLAFEYLLEKHKEVFVLGQGVWSPWYVGNTMLALEKKFGKERIIDTPVSEAATTGAAIGAALCGYRPIVIHPRMDFMILACDAIVNQAAKWSHMLGGQAHAPVTIRSIINRGGEQGAQHSQALHSWFAHIPGLRVVMPATAADARDLLVSSVLNDDPVLYIDDRWLYDAEDDLQPIDPKPLHSFGPIVRRTGTDVTLVGAGWGYKLVQDAANLLQKSGVSAETIDVRILNPFDARAIVASVRKTGRLIVADGSWETCGFGGEVIASVAEKMPVSAWRANPLRISLASAPAPTSKPLEAAYYPTAEGVFTAARNMVVGTAVA
jgi:pyruvate dehydrogenase E1 component beta subunit